MHILLLPKKNHYVNLPNFTFYTLIISNYPVSNVCDTISFDQKSYKSYINLNDNTIEGIRVKDRASFSVQYHPESAPGPHDSNYLFDDFVAGMETHMQEAGVLNNLRSV